MWWTLAAAVIASTTALFIALVVYPWQKRLDRENKIIEEKRSSYAKYLKISSEFKSEAFRFFVDVEKGRSDKNLNEISIIRERDVHEFATLEVTLVAPEKILDQMLPHYECIRDLASVPTFRGGADSFKIKLEKEEQLRADLAMMMRQDIHSDASSKVVVPLGLGREIEFPILRTERTKLRED